MQQIVNTHSMVRLRIGVSPMLRRVIVLLVVLVAVAVTIADAAEAATLASTAHRLAGAVSTEFSRLLGLVGILIAAGLVLAIDRRRRIRTPRSTA